MTNTESSLLAHLY